MDQELARRLFAEGAALVLLDVPERTEFGIDYNCWNVGPKFKGVKMIPPGLHFVYYSAVSKQGESAPRTGFFHFFDRHEVVVLRWDHSTEDLTDSDITTETVDRIKAGLKDLDSSLGAYPYDTLKKWVSLSNFVSKDLASRLQPVSGKITSVTQIENDTSLTGAGDTMQGEGEGEGEGKGGEREGEGEGKGGEGEGEGDGEAGEEERGKIDGRTEYAGGRFAGVGDFEPTVQKPAKKKVATLPLFRCTPESALRFSEVPQQRHPAEASPSEISRHHMDLSYTLDSMIASSYEHYEELLGELQFSFICFFLAHVYDAFEHWKELVKLLCFCERALSAHSDLFTNFITVLHFQLKEIPDDFFVDIVSRNNFLTTTLQVFFSSLEQGGGSLDAALVRKAMQFRENLTKRYNWDFSAEPDEYAPTVVNTD